MKVAVVGAGIAGLAAAHALQGRAQVTLYEAQGRLGGQADTHAILLGDRAYPVDSGFTSFNEPGSPAFGAWLRELGIGTRPADLTLGVGHVGRGFTYSTRSYRSLLCEPRQLLSPAFLSLLRDLRRFHAEGVPARTDDPRTLGDYIAGEGYGSAFRTYYLWPVGRALWSLPPERIDALPLVHALPWLLRHRLLPGTGEAGWRVVEGGSAAYVAAFAARFRGRIQRRDPVIGVSRQPGQAVVTSVSGRQSFDAVVLACHADEALGLLEDPSRAEREVLGAIRFRRNRVVVHSDPSVMPRNRQAWSGLNVLVGGADDAACQVTWWVNRHQSLAGREQLFITHDPAIALERTWSAREYTAPVLDRPTLAAQRRLGEISGVRNTWYCGAYWGAGFHEDGFASGLRVAHALADRAARAA